MVDVVEDEAVVRDWSEWSAAERRKAAAVVEPVELRADVRGYVARDA